MEIGYTETYFDGTTGVFAPAIFNRPPHQDLKNALSGLRVHLGVLTDLIPEKRAGDQEEIEKFKINGYSITGDEDSTGFVLKGQRIGKRGNTTINTPNVRFEQSSENEYLLMGDLEDKIAVIEDEVRKYLFEGKKQPDAQTSMDFGDEPVTHAQIAEPESPVFKGDSEKPKNKKKVRQTAEAPSGEVEA